VLLVAADDVAGRGNGPLGRAAGAGAGLDLVAACRTQGMSLDAV